VPAGVIRPIAPTTDSRPGLALRAWAHLRRGIQGAALAALLALMWAQAAGAGTAQYYYDELGRLIETVAADGTSVQYRYDAVGNILSVRHYSATAVAISGFMPVSGSAGTAVTIYGSGFNATPTNNTVKFNGTLATVTGGTTTSLTVTVPAGASSGTITVKSGSTTATSSSSFTVAALAAPTITSFTPTIAPQGTAITITGTNFQTALQTDKVQFGTVPAAPTTATASSISVPVPTSGASGKLSVTTPYGVATSNADFFAVPNGYSAADVQFTGRMSTTGNPLTVSISTANKTGYVLFDGVAGQGGLKLSLSGVTMGGSLTVFAPDGTALVSGGIANGQIALPRLPMIGTYTMILSPGASTGTATLQLGTVDLTIGPLTMGAIVANQDGSWTIPVTYTVTNNGTLAAMPSWYDIGYLSANGVLDNGSLSNGFLNNRDTALAPGASYTVTANFTATPSTAAGNYTFFVKTDGHSDSIRGGSGNFTVINNTDNGELLEVDETNNTSSATVTLARPDLTIGPLTIGAIVAQQDGSWTIPVTYTVTNNSTATAQPNWYDIGYLSANGVLDNSSQSNGFLNQRSTALAPGASYTVTANFTTSPGTAARSYTFFVKTDGHNSSYTGGSNTDNGSLTEANETNNTSSASLTLSPDLTIGPLSIGTIAANQDGSWTIPVTYTVTNVGTVAAIPSWFDVGYLSANGVLDNSSQSNGFLNRGDTALAPGASYPVTANFTTSTSTAAGSYTFFVKTDGHNSYLGGTNTDSGVFVEPDETNNTSSATVTLARADLTVGPLTLGTIVANQDGSWTIPVTYTVTNSGTVAAPNYWWDVGYLSANGVLDNNTQSSGYLYSRNTPLAPGASYTVTANFTTSTSTAAGSYTFFVKADGHNASTTGGTNTDNGNLIEANDSNNTASAAVTLALTQPDLTIGPLTLGTIVANQDGSWTIPVTYTVTNNGTVAAPNYWWDVGYLSANGVLDNNAQSTGYLNSRNTPLAPGASYSITANFTTAAGTAPGNYTFFVKADGHAAWSGGTNTDSGNLVEADETNNAASITVTLARADLAIGSLTIGTIVANQDGSWTIPVTYTVTNVSTVAAPNYWWDVGYLSANYAWDNNAQSTGYLYSRNTPLAPGASYTVTASFTTTTSTAPGGYLFFVKTDGHNASLGGTNTDNGNLTEPDEMNNIYAAPVTLAP
jgi:YD repeat-containing protein